MTIALLAGTAVIWIAFDVWAGYSGKAPLISNTVYNLSIEYPVFPFAVGLLMGHFFWPV